MTLAFTLVSAAVGLGIVLALWHLRANEGRRHPPWSIGAVHGVLGLAGLAALVVVLQGPRHGDAMGVGSFGTVAAMLFATALATGLTIPLLIWQFPRLVAGVIVLHAGIAVTGYVLFLAWRSMG